MTHAHQSFGTVVEQAMALGAAHRCPGETVAIGRAHGRVIAAIEPMEPGCPAPGLYLASGERVAIAPGALSCGRVLSPARLAVAAALGVETLHVSRRPTVALVGVCGAADPCAESAVAARTSGALLTGLVRAEGLEPTAWPALANDPVQIEISIRDTACAFDVVVVHAADDRAMQAVVDVIARFGAVLGYISADTASAPQVLLARLDQACVLVMGSAASNVLAAWLGIGRVLTDALQGRLEPRPVLRATLAEPVEALAPCARPVHLVTDGLGRLLATPVRSLSPEDFAECDGVLLAAAEAGATVDVVPMR